MAETSTLLKSTVTHALCQLHSSTFESNLVERIVFKSKCTLGNTYIQVKQIVFVFIIALFSTDMN